MILAPSRKIIAPDYCPTCGKVRHPRRAPTFPARRNRWLPNRWRGGVDAMNAGSGIQVDSSGRIKVKSNGIVVAGASDPCCCALPPQLLACPSSTPSGIGLTAADTPAGATAGSTVIYGGYCYVIGSPAASLTPSTMAASLVSGCSDALCPTCTSCHSGLPSSFSVTLTLDFVPNSAGISAGFTACNCSFSRICSASAFACVYSSDAFIGGTGTCWDTFVAGHAPSTTVDLLAPTGANWCVWTIKIDAASTDIYSTGYGTSPAGLTYSSGSPSRPFDAAGTLTLLAATVA